MITANVSYAVSTLNVYLLVLFVINGTDWLWIHPRFNFTKKGDKNVACYHM